MSWGPSKMQTQVPPWLSLSSRDMAESCSSLFANDTLVVLVVKEGSSLEFAWKLHPQWLRGVFCVIMIVHGLTRHHRQTIDQECMSWCGGILFSWSLLLTCEMVSLRVMKTDIDWLIWRELLPASHQPPSLSPRKVQCLVAFDVTHDQLICLSTSYE
jgi:hypothetical protein